jgi:hypothetical protein
MGIGFLQRCKLQHFDGDFILLECCFHIACGEFDLGLIRVEKDADGLGAKEWVKCESQHTCDGGNGCILHEV